jgi:hypothetical protein
MKWTKPELEQLERREAPTSFGVTSHVVQGSDPGPGPVGPPVKLGGSSGANADPAPSSPARA